MFTKNESGSIAVIFALCIFVLFAAAGLAVDYSRAALARVEMQKAADSAALSALASEGEDFEGKVESRMRLSDQETKLNTTVTNFAYSEDTGLSFDANTQIPTTLLRVVGIDNVDVSVHTKAVREGGASLEVVLALDTTYSMNGERLTSLKEAARTLVDELEKYEDTEKHYGLVPFGQYVNVGMSRRYESWIDVPEDTRTTKENCYNHRPVVREYDCVTKSETRYNDGVPYTHTYKSCKREYGPSEWRCTTSTSTTKWSGCVGSREDHNTLDTSTPQIPGLMNTSCGREIVDLTSDAGDIKMAITNLNAVGETYIPSGLEWGWRMLSPKEPLSEGKPKNQEGHRKFVVLFTDGLNTKSPKFPYHTNSNREDADEYLSELCTNAKADDIDIFAISFDVNDDKLHELLRGCATSVSHYYDIRSLDLLKEAFGKIAKSIGRLRLAQ